MIAIYNDGLRKTQKFMNNHTGARLSVTPLKDDLTSSDNIRELALSKEKGFLTDVLPQRAARLVQASGEELIA